jgi:AcrR family transcriptional regulator
MRTVDPERHARRRAHILEAAAVLFAERGYDGTTTAAICKRAGIGSGTLFHYFPDKSSIFRDLFADDLAKTRAVVGELDDSEPLAALLALIEHRIADAGNPLVPGLLVAAIIRAERDEQFASLVADDEAFLRKTMTRLLRSAIANGSVDASLDADLTARWLGALVDTLYFRAGDPAFNVARDTRMFFLIVRRTLALGDRPTPERSNRLLRRATARRQSRVDPS